MTLCCVWSYWDILYFILNYLFLFVGRLFNGREHHSCQILWHAWRWPI